MFVDLIIIAIVAIFLVLGILQGFVVSVLYLVAWFFGVLSAWLFAGAFGALLDANIEGLSHFLSLALGALFAFLVPFLLVRSLAAVAKHLIKKSGPLTMVNRILGGGFGVLKGVVVSAVFLTVIHLLPTQGSLKQAMESSISYSVYKAIPFADLWKEFKVETESISI